MHQQELEKQSGFYASEAEWLGKALAELKVLDVNEDVKEKQDQLHALHRHHETLKPNVREVLTISAVVSESHDLKEVVESHLERLNEIAAVFKGDEQLGSLGFGRLRLAEQEVVFLGV